MAHSVDQEITCPQCGEKGVHKTWIAFEQDSAEALDALFGGKFAKYTCPGCGAELTIQFSCRYYDADHNAMVFYTPDDTEAAAMEAMLAQAGDSPELPPEFRAGVTRRIVRTIPDLGEKIRVFADGLDDEALEVVKKLAIHRASATDIEMDGTERVYYDGLNEDGNLDMLVDPNDDQLDGVLLVPVPRALYDAAERAQQ